MITLKTSLLSDNLGLNNEEDIVVKSVSAAWNKIREIRDTTDADILNETILVVEQDDETKSDKIPNKIYFSMNKNGKIEFKDYAKEETRKEKKNYKIQKRIRYGNSVMTFV